MLTFTDTDREIVEISGTAPKLSIVLNLDNFDAGSSRNNVTYSTPGDPANSDSATVDVGTGDLTIGVKPDVVIELESMNLNAALTVNGPGVNCGPVLQSGGTINTNNHGISLSGVGNKDYGNGVQVTGSLQSGTGDISLTGFGAAGKQYGDGVVVSNGRENRDDGNRQDRHERHQRVWQRYRRGGIFGAGTLLSAVDGDISLAGTEAGSGSTSPSIANAAGVSIGYGSVQVTTSGKGNIKIAGTSSNLGTGVARSVNLAFGVTVDAKGAGDIDIKGDGASAYVGINLASDTGISAQVLADGTGSISLNGAAGKRRTAMIAASCCRGSAVWSRRPAAI